ncbi:phage regulatory CII family protein [Ancylobacter radicis]|uniref:Transcriptional regulator n=1 Tax=Ancylobacter radicis TaxID=2836179 RepID=A0ABS5R4S7_9HYPH|nr:phage regulatory CII family protein [Ancylobacter radicis]MBS9476210.1 hypothetical protein [Ancylobacter radicis]
MSERAVSDVWFHRIKAATRDLVKACGGVERAADMARVSSSTIQRWYSPKDNDVIPITAVLSLEADCEMPFVTQVMAELNGRTLADSDPSPDCTSSIASGHNKLMGKLVELTKEVIAAKADGVVTPTEAEVIDRKTAEMVQVAGELRQTCAAKKAGVRLVR